MASHYDQSKLATVNTCVLCASLKERGVPYYSSQKYLSRFTPSDTKAFAEHLLKSHSFSCAYCPTAFQWSEVADHLRGCKKCGTDIGIEKKPVFKSIFKQPALVLKKPVKKVLKKSPIEPVVKPITVVKTTVTITLEKEPVPYIVPPRVGTPRMGTFDYPALCKIVKTKATMGRWYTPVTYIFNMDGYYYHIRKDGVSKVNRNEMHMRCNNGATCPWVGTLTMTNRGLRQHNASYFDTNNYSEVQLSNAVEHSDECIEKGMADLPSDAEAARLPQNAKPITNDHKRRERQSTSEMRNLFIANPIFLVS